MQCLEIYAGCVTRHCLTEDRQGAARFSVEPIFSRKRMLQGVARWGLLSLLFTFHPGTETAPGYARPPQRDLRSASHELIA